MPSPTLMTAPTSSTETVLLVVFNLLAQNLADFVRSNIRHACSVAEPWNLSVKDAPKARPCKILLTRRQARAHLVQPAAQRAIVNRVPDSHDRAAQ